jgi:hypothetical protein
MLQKEYETENVPNPDRVSRRRMWEFFLARQEIAQVHRAMPKSSMPIIPISVPKRWNTAQADLISKANDDAAIWKAILVVIDVASRKVYTVALKGTSSKLVAEAMKKVLSKARRDMKDGEKSGAGVWKNLQTDNGPEFSPGKEFGQLMKDKGIKHVFGVPSRSSSQGIVERVNRSLQISLEKKMAVSGEPWWEELPEMTRLYNTKPHRLLRLKREGDSKYTYYSPNELLKVEPDVLKEIHGEKMKDLGQAKKLPKQDHIKEGTLVRVADLAKRKADIKKGFKQNFSSQVYEVYKIKKGSVKFPANRFYVHEQDRREAVFRNKTSKKAIPFTIKDLLVIDEKIEGAPENMVKGDGAPEPRVTRSKAAPRRSGRQRKEPERLEAG